MADEPQPRLDRIVEPLISPGAAEFVRAGEPRHSGPPGTLLLLAGSGFGEDPDEVVANFGPVAVEVFPGPFLRDEHAVVAVPTLPPGAVPVSVTVGERTSNELEFAVSEQRAAGRPGAVTRRFVTAVEAFAVLASEEVRLADFGRFAPPEVRDQLAARMLAARG
ncbi:MAG: IPT/TIG domain-containing protein, partial [Candidatus Limnocylindria bacterium]